MERSALNGREGRWRRAGWQTQELSYEILVSPQSTPDTVGNLRAVSVAMKTSKPIALIVDDQETLRVILGSFLHANGFRVLMAGTGRHAFEYADASNDQST